MALSSKEKKKKFVYIPRDATGICYICKKRKPDLTTEHIIPKCFGGGGVREGNIKQACLKCNRNKDHYIDQQIWDLMNDDQRHKFYVFIIFSLYERKSNEQTIEYDNLLLECILVMTFEEIREALTLSCLKWPPTKKKKVKYVAAET